MAAPYLMVSLSLIFGEAQWRLIIAIIPFVVLLAFNFGLIFMISRCYRKCPPGRAIVRTGWGGMKFTWGGGIWAIPIMHQVQLLNLTPLRIELNDDSTFHPAAPRQFTVAISELPDLLVKAANRLVDLTPDEIQQHATDLIVDFLRQSLPLSKEDEEAPDLHKLEHRLRTALAQLGLEVLSIGYNETNATTQASESS